MAIKKLQVFRGSNSRTVFISWMDESTSGTLDLPVDLAVDAVKAMVPAILTAGGPFLKIETIPHDVAMGRALEACE